MILAACFTLRGHDIHAAMCEAGNRGTVMVIMLYTTQSKVDWFLTRGKMVYCFPIVPFLLLILFLH